MSNRVVAILLLACVYGESLAVANDVCEPIGRWILLSDVHGTSELVLLDISENSKGFEIDVVDARSAYGPLVLKRFDSDPGRLSIAFQADPIGEMSFEGELKNVGTHAGEFLGTVEVGDSLVPARLKRTKVEKLKDRRTPPFEEYHQMLRSASNVKDVTQRAALFADMVRKAPGPGTAHVFNQLLHLAGGAGFTEMQIRELLKPWFSVAEWYGPKWLAKARFLVVRSLRHQPEFSQIAIEVADEARKNLNDFRSLDSQSSLLHFMAEAAKLANKTGLAADAERQAAEIDARLDADYNARVPPFKSQPFAVRESPNDDRVVLLELFTGAACPPCAGADIACDAIDATFQHGELILMQYHLHIPTVDPLANPDTIKRQSYYGLKGVPIAYFNGSESARGGGRMEAAEELYQEYRRRVQAQLHGKSSVAMKLNVTRTANNITICSTAEVVPSHERDKSDEKEGGPQPKLRLRFALTENVVRYNGGNGVRINHHVVQDFPGGLEGRELSGDRTEVQLELNLADVRRDLNDYRDQQANIFAFFSRSPLPPLDLKHLAVVAFVQDDKTKRVLHAVQVNVPEEESVRLQHHGDPQRD